MSSGKDLTMVMKLNKKIKDAEYMKEDKLLRILNQLLCVDMTLEILQSTHVGVTVNPLKKVEGKVGTVAKEIIKKWKKLLPDKSSTSKVDLARPAKKSPLRIDEHKDVDTTPRYSSEASCSSSSCSEKTEGNDDRLHSQMCAAPPPNFKRPFPGIPALPCQNHSIAKPRMLTEFDMTVETANDLPDDSSSGFPRKRKGPNLSSGESETIAVALTKRSRTQVYSGKSAGLKYVPSLFDICMNILIDNIDAIDEVGGVPFFVLEPVLTKCTPTQLMRLEEHNPHFIEDSDSLWEKYAGKEFKGAKPSKGGTWRDLYMEKLAEREQKMKSITSIIKARQQARETPVRKAAILNSAPLPPSRHRRGQSFNLYRGGPEEDSTPNLMKKTMKMAKSRQMMISSRPKR